MRTHPLVKSQDLPTLPEELKNYYEEVYCYILSLDPDSCCGLGSHDLERPPLDDCRTLEIEWEGDTYRLVYRIDKSPKSMRVDVISFALHDPAYDKAKQRIVKKKTQKGL